MRNRGKPPSNCPRLPPQAIWADASLITHFTGACNQKVCDAGSVRLFVRGLRLKFELDILDIQVRLTGWVGSLGKGKGGATPGENVPDLAIAPPAGNIPSAVLLNNRTRFGSIRTITPLTYTEKYV